MKIILQNHKKPICLGQKINMIVIIYGCACATGALQILKDKIPRSSYNKNNECFAWGQVYEIRAVLASASKRWRVCGLRTWLSSVWSQLQKWDADQHLQMGMLQNLDLEQNILATPRHPRLGAQEHSSPWERDRISPFPHFIFLGITNKKRPKVAIFANPYQNSKTCYNLDAAFIAEGRSVVETSSANPCGDLPGPAARVCFTFPIPATPAAAVLEARLLV